MVCQITLKFWVLGLLALVLSASPMALAHTEAAQLSWTPHSTSYLPFRTGPLSELNGTGLPRAIQELLPLEVLERTETMSTIARFDLLRERLFGVKEPLEPSIRQSYFQGRDTPFWYGLCDRWSASALDPQINQMLAKADDLVCNGVHLTKGELKELVTAFYRYEVAAYIGRRTNEDPRKEITLMRDELGMDDLPAHVFHKTVFDNLRTDRGVVIELSSNHKVWNHPLHKAVSQVQRIGVEEIARGHTPPFHHTVFIAFDDQAQTLLGAYGEIERALLEYSRFDQRKPGVDGKFRKRAEDIGRKGKSFGPWPRNAADALVSVRRSLWGKVKKRILEGSIRLNPDFTFDRYKTEINYGIESSFGGVTDRSRNRTFEYVIVRQGDQPIASIWITREKDRPDFLWIPRPAAPNAAQSRPRSPDIALRDLSRLIETCPGLNDVRGFLTQLDEAVADRVIDTAERSALLKTYSALKGAVNPDEMKRRLHKVEGLTLQDLESVEATVFIRHRDRVTNEPDFEI